VGTQMIAKGHDFRRITLVAALAPDGALFSNDFRGAERLFALLMQAGGRAGRDAQAQGAEMWVQTQHPSHPLYAALQRHDYPSFAASQLTERQQGGMPPFMHQALVRAEARSQSAAQAFLTAAADAARGDAMLAAHLAAHLGAITLYPAVPMVMQRVAHVERAQMLVESPNRRALQAFLSQWHPLLHAARRQPQCQGLLRWAVDVDPVTV